MPERFCEFVSGLQQQRQMFRGGAAGVGHVDMRIGAVGDQRIGVFDHLRRDIGMQVEADHQRQILADHLAHARENFAFAVVEMLGDHGAVQVEIDRIEPARRLDAVDQDLGDALVGIFGHMRRRAGGSEDRRYQLPAIGFGRLDEACEPDIDVAHSSSTSAPTAIAGQPPPCTKSA